MIKSNGGVFGRNPTFNDVQVDGNLTVNGDIALGDDIVVADSLTVQGTTASTSTTTGALVVTGGVGVGGALYTGGNAVINGVTAGIPASGGSNTVFGAAALRSTAVGNQNVAIGSSALGTTGTAFTGNTNCCVGHSAGANLTGSSNSNTIVGSSSISPLSATYNSATFVGAAAGVRNQVSNTTGVGSSALLANTLGTANVAMGFQALAAATTAIATVTTTVAGTGGTDGAKTAVQLERDSGGTMVTYPTVDLTVTGGAVSGTVTVATGGSASTSNTAGGIIFRANAAGIAAGVPADWRCQLTFAATAASNTAIGHQAGVMLTTATSNTIVGASAGDAITTGNGNTAIGSAAAGSLTTGIDNVAIGISSLTALTAGTNTVAIGRNALSNVSSSPGNSNNNVAIGQDAGRFRGTGSDTLTQANSTIVIGQDVRPSGNSELNQIVIGFQGRGDGSNTSVLGNIGSTQARIYGGTFLSTGANGQSTQLGQSTTLLSALSGATVTATNLIPANCILLGVTARVTTAITGATTFDIGDGTTANRFGDDIAIALNTTANNCIAPALITAATNVVLTANGSNFTGGAVRLTAHFMTLVAPTS